MLIILAACGNSKSGDPTSPPKIPGKVSIGVQDRTITEGTGGYPKFPVTTQDVDDGEYGTIAWYENLAGTTPINAANGISLRFGFTVLDNKASVELDITGEAAAGITISE